MIGKLRKNHQIFCTTRNYREVVHLSKIRRLNLKVVGKHGGAKKHEKLNASIERMKGLSKIIKKQNPDLAMSFCSPEASRVAFGVGINHIAFSDSPHAAAVMSLSVPLVQRLLIPWIIPKKEFTKFGIEPKNIIQYRAIDAAITVKRKIPKKASLPFLKKNKKTILIRVEEDQAAYMTKNSNRSFAIIEAIIQEFGDQNIIVVGRYPHQIKRLQHRFGSKAKVLTKILDGKALLEKADVFIGSGGTMTAESALLGVPTISFYAVPNFIEKYLIQKKLIRKVTEPKKVALQTRDLLKKSQYFKTKAIKVSKIMEDPYPKLVKAIKSLS